MHIANKALQQFWDGRLPVDIKAIAASMGITIQPDPSLGDASGHYFRESPNGPLITYNPYEYPTRQRFTIAHELGHHLQGDWRAPRDTSANMFSRDPSEIGANAIAASLLMPENIVRQVVYGEGISDVNRLAEIFDVSTQAMTYRLMHLGII